MGCLTGRIHQHAGMLKEPPQKNSRPDAGPMIEDTQHSSTNDDENTLAKNFAANLNPQPCDATTDGAPTEQEEPDSETDLASTQEEKPNVNSETDSETDVTDPALAQAEELANSENDSAFNDDDE